MWVCDVWVFQGQVVMNALSPRPKLTQKQLSEENGKFTLDRNVLYFMPPERTSNVCMKITYRNLTLTINGITDCISCKVKT